MSTEPYTVITLKDVYTLLIQVRDITLAEQEKRRNLTLQVKALWGACALLLAPIVAAVVHGFK